MTFDKHSYKHCYKKQNSKNKTQKENLTLCKGSGEVITVF